MRTITIVAGLMLMLSACGGSSSGTASTPAPVESATASGEVASFLWDMQPCTPSPPPQSRLRANTDDNDGVVGTITNTQNEIASPYSGQPSDLIITRRIPEGMQWVCYIEPGKSTPFAFGDGVEFGIGLRSWLVDLTDEKDKSGRGWLHLKLEDPTFGYPSVTWWCPLYAWSDEDGGAKSKRLSEGEDAVMGYVRRLPDEAAAAREFSGTKSSNVDDWARIDIRYDGEYQCYPRSG